MDNKRDLLKTITKLKRTFQALSLMYITSFVIILIAFAAAISYGSDRLINPDRTERLIISVFLLAIICSITYRILKRAFKFNLTSANLASVVQKHFPGLGDSLISSVELIEDPHAAPFFVDKLICATNQKLRKLSLIRIFNVKLLFSLLSSLTIIAACLAFTFHNNSQAVNIWAKRCILFQDVAWPTSTTFELNLSSNPYTITKGQDLNVTAKAIGSDPAQALLHYRFGKTDWHTDNLKRDSDGKYTFLFQSISDDLELYVTGGDYNFDFPRYNIVTKPAPELSGWSILYQFPAYTGLKPSRQDKFNTIKALHKTTVEILFTFDRPVKNVRVWAERNKPNNQILDTTSFKTTFELESDDLLYIQASDHDEITNLTPIKFPIRAVPDNPPTIRWKQMSLMKRPVYTQDAEISFTLEAHDDIGITSTTVQATSSNTQQTIAVHEFEGKINLADITVKDESGERRLKHGDTIALTAQVTDNSPQLQKSSTLPFTIYISSFQELDSAIWDEMSQFKRLLEESSTLSGKMLRYWESEQNIVRLSEAHIVQLHNLKSLLQGLQEPLNNISELVDVNKKNFEHTKLIKEYARSAIQSSINSCEKVLGKIDSIEKMELMKTEQKIDAILTDLIRALEFWKDYDEVIRDLSNASAHQQKIIDTLEQLKEKHLNNNSQISEQLQKCYQLQNYVFDKLSRLQKPILQLSIVLSFKGETIKSKVAQTIFEYITPLLDMIEKAMAEILNLEIHSSLTSATKIHNEIKKLLDWLINPSKAAKELLPELTSKDNETINADIKNPVESLTATALDKLQQIQNKLSTKLDELKAILPSVHDPNQKQELQKSEQKYQEAMKETGELKKKVDEIKKQVEMVGLKEDKEKEPLNLDDVAKTLKQINEGVQNATKAVEKQLFDKAIQDLKATLDELKRSSRPPGEQADQKDKSKESIDKEAKGQNMGGKHDEGITPTSLRTPQGNLPILNESEYKKYKQQFEFRRLSSQIVLPYSYEEQIRAYYKFLATHDK
ncbi:MAG: hypothetical protein HY606_08955 [Planctomycetes bacterium]|nr:hypothetical protein [Planctomycetota bacterium]